MTSLVAMRITELAKQTGATTDEIRVFESKGYIQCRWVTLTKRRVRDYPETELVKVERIIHYRREGFEHAAAFKRAVEDLERPRLL